MAHLQGTQDRQTQKCSPLLTPTKEISAMARNLCCSARAKFLCQSASLHTFGLPGLVFSPFLCQRFARKNYPFSQGTMCSMQMKANSSGVNHLTCHWAKQSFWSWFRNGHHIHMQALCWLYLPVPGYSHNTHRQGCLDSRSNKYIPI